MNDDGVDDSTRSVAVTRTYLTMQSPSQLAAGAPPTVDASWVRVDPCSVSEWRALYRDIGGPWHWHDRDAWADERLAAHLASDKVRIYRVDAMLPLHTCTLDGVAALPNYLARGFVPDRTEVYTAVIRE